MAYAAKTEVSTERTRGEIEGMLNRAGATGYGYVRDSEAMAERIEFRMPRGRNTWVVRLQIAVPDRKDHEHSDAGRRRSPVAAQASWEQAHRAAWRQLALILKAKLVAVESGVRTFEQEFLPDIVTADGRTLLEHALPQLGGVTGSGMLALPAARGA